MNSSRWILTTWHTRRWMRRQLDAQANVMSWSMGETRALAQKAARGAGLPWGLAEEAGFAVLWLQAYGAPGALALARYLRWRESHAGLLSAVIDLNEPSTAESVHCPLTLGTAISDAKTVPAHPMQHVRQPLLLAPFLAAGSGGRTCTLQFDNAHLIVNRHTLTCTGDRGELLVDRAACHIAYAPETTDQSGTCAVKSRVPTAEREAMEMLQTYAARTYAPATEQSRLSGAGAGLTDND